MILRDRSELDLAEAMLAEAMKPLRERLQQQPLTQYREQLAFTTSHFAQVQALREQPESARAAFQDLLTTVENGGAGRLNVVALGC